jgi:hypothetical protein
MKVGEAWRHHLSDRWRWSRMSLGGINRCRVVGGQREEVTVETTETTASNGKGWCGGRGGSTWASSVMGTGGKEPRHPSTSRYLEYPLVR